MNLKRTVRLKILFLFSISALFADASIPQDDRDDRVATEAGEIEWVSTVVNGLNSSDVNGTNKLKADLVRANTEPFTTTPASHEKSIECASYDETQCLKEGKCDITTETCRTEKHLKVVKCLAIFSLPEEIDANSTDLYLKTSKRQIKRLACLQYQAEDSQECTESDKCHQDGTFTNGIGTCCCSTPNCNVLEKIMMKNPALQGVNQWTNDSLNGTSPYHFAEGLDVDEIYWSITIALAIIFAMGCLVLFYVICKCLKKKGKSHIVIEEEKEVAMETGNLPLIDAEVMIEMVETPKELPITDFQLIVRGRFGLVYKAKWTENGESRNVAVKKISPPAYSSYSWEKDIFSELSAFSKWYPSIVQFICAEKIGDEYWIVTEFHDRLSLFEMLQYNVISVAAAARIIVTMIDGLQFLHDDRPFFFMMTKKPIIHRDIKSKNILVKRDMTACIADFGLARLFEFNVENSDILAQVGTKRYMSPEMLEGATEFTAPAFKAMDVYSMALVMWEVISRTQLHENDEVPSYEPPYKLVGPCPSIGVMRTHVVSRKLRPEFRAEARAHNFIGGVIEIAEEMWDPEACVRITAGCAFSRVYNRVAELADGSRSEDVPSETRDGIVKMLNYHQSPNTVPHPTPDPSNFYPPLPPYPKVTDSGVYHEDQLMVDRTEEPQFYDQQDEEPSVEKIFDVAMNRLLTREEQELLAARRPEECNTRSSTPTPSGSYF